jgi:hypothetical protein
MLATTESTSMSFSEVSSLLWQEREALELLLFKLVEERLIVAAGETRWLAAANREIESVVIQLRGVEVVRAAEVDSIAAELGRAEALTLTELAAVADEPWASILTEHRDAMLKLVVQIEQAADENRRLLTAGARAVRETLLAMTESVDIYDARGMASPAALRSVIMDEQA